MAVVAPSWAPRRDHVRDVQCSSDGAGDLPMVVRTLPGGFRHGLWDLASDVFCRFHLPKTDPSPPTIAAKRPGPSRVPSPKLIGQRRSQLDAPSSARLSFPTAPSSGRLTQPLNGPRSSRNLSLLSQPATAMPKRLPGRVHGRRAFAGKVRLENKLFDKALVHFEFNTLIEFVYDPEHILVPGR